jgi:hypothetical protein
LFGGSITVALNSPATAQPLYNSDGRTLTGFASRVTVTGGALTLSLEANDLITPAGTSYTARFQPDATTGGAAWSETWIVPTSGSPVKVHVLRSTTTPIPALLWSPSQLSSGGASNGQVLAWNGSSWTPINNSSGAAYTASAVIDAGEVPDGSCLLDGTAVTVTGAALGSRPTLGSSIQPPQGVTVIAKVTGPNSMKLETCNFSGGSYNPASATYYFGAN